jgi:hypothetical protein
LASSGRLGRKIGLLDAGLGGLIQHAKAGPRALLIEIGQFTADIRDAGERLVLVVAELGERRRVEEPLASASRQGELLQVVDRITD